MKLSTLIYLQRTIVRLCMTTSRCESKNTKAVKDKKAAQSCARTIASSQEKQGNAGQCDRCQETIRAAVLEEIREAQA